MAYWKGFDWACLSGLYSAFGLESMLGWSMAFGTVLRSGLWMGSETASGWEFGMESGWASGWASVKALTSG
jgi:hypothetical protein